MNTELSLVVSQGLLALVVGFLVHGLKMAGMASRYASLAAAVIGMVCGILASYLSNNNMDLVTGAFAGLIAGATASGFYSGGKSLMEKKKK